jgi:hypothetical protein
MSKKTKENLNNGSPLPVYPVCCVGSVMCKHPEPDDQDMTTECDNCDKDCHDCCGQLLDVPDKLFETQPGYYCQKCVARLPRYLYPKIAKDGVAKNIPKEMNHGLSLHIFLCKQKKLREAKSKKPSRKSTRNKKRVANI